MGNMISHRPAPLRPLGNMIGDGPALYYRPRAAVTSSTRLHDRSVLLESADIPSDYILFSSYFQYFCHALLEQQTVLRDRFLARPLLLGSYFQYFYHALLEQQTVLRDRFIAQPFSCASANTRLVYGILLCTVGGSIFSI
jgi:hypothetical protein